MSEFMLAGFLIAVGLTTAAAFTHLYQGVRKEQAMLRFDGKTVFGMVGHLAMSFICGPYIMLQMGWRQEDDGTIALGAVLVSALVAFGWAFLTGLLLMGSYVAVLG